MSTPITALLVALLLGLFLLPTTAPAAPATLMQGDPTPSPDAQCELTLSQRSGNWFCPDTTPESAAQAVQQAEADLLARGAIEEVTPVVQALAGYCRVEGCWERIDAGHSLYSATGSYGYGRTHLGNIKFYFRVIMRGALHHSYPFWFSSTRGTKNITLSGERLYLSAAHPGGHSMTPRHSFRKSFTAAAADVATQWPSPGPSTYENTVIWVTVAHQATWSDPSSNYPGTWFIWAKSIKMLRQPSGAYHVQGDSDLPKDPAGFGWRR